MTSRALDMKSPKVIRMMLIGFAICCLIFYLRFTKPISDFLSFDDAYMFLRYAKHWLSGMGFSWNPDEGPVYGITSVSYLLVITAVRGLTNLPDTLVLTTISFVAGLASVACLTIMGFALFKRLRRYYLPLLVIPSMVLSEVFAYHSGTTGMETTLALLFNSVLAAMAYLLAETRSTKYLILCLIAAYASFITRPDSGLYCLLLLPLLLIANDRRHWKVSLRYVLAFLALLCIDLLFKKAMFGDFLPLPFFSKDSGFFLGYIGTHQWNAAQYTFIFFRESLLYILAIVCFASRETLSRLIAILLPVLLTFGYFTRVVQIMGFQGRYYYPALSFLILAAFVAVNSYLDKSDLVPHGKFTLPILRPVIALVLLIILTSPLAERAVAKAWQKWIIGQPTHFKVETQYRTRATEKLPVISRRKADRAINTLLQHLPPDVVLAFTEHGRIGSENPATPIIDIVGLHDRHIAHNGFTADYLFARMPDIIWIHPHYTHIIKEIIDNKEFWEKYDFYPNAYRFGLAVLKNSPASEDINRNLAKEFERIYPGRVLSDYKAEPLDTKVKT